MPTCSAVLLLGSTALQSAQFTAAADGNGSHVEPNPPAAEPQLVTPEEEAEREASSFLAIFVCLVLLVVGTLATYALRRSRVPVPESWVYVALGAMLSTIIYSGASDQLKLIRETLHDSFSVIFFAALLPVIIFESGYSMHKVRPPRLFAPRANATPCLLTEKLLLALWVYLYLCICGHPAFCPCRERVHVALRHSWTRLP